MKRFDANMRLGAALGLVGICAAMFLGIHVVLGNDAAAGVGAVGSDDVTRSEPAQPPRPVELDSEYEIVRMRVTAYCPCPRCCGQYSDGYTANGHRIEQGDRFVAADPKYGFGTQMIIEGYNDGKPVEVLDRGGVIKGDRLDVFFNCHDQALEWGVQYVDVRILR